MNGPNEDQPEGEDEPYKCSTEPDMRKHNKPLKANKKPAEVPEAKKLPRPPAEMVSIFNNSYPLSTEEDWIFKDPVGWICSQSENYAFRESYRKCKISGDWHKKDLMGRMVNGDLVINSKAKAAGMKLCPLSNFWCKLEDMTIKVRSGPDGVTTYCSKEYVEKTGYVFDKCDYSNEQWINHPFVQVHKSEKYKRITLNSAKYSGAFKTCGNCGNWHELAALTTYPEHNLLTPTCSKCSFNVIKGKVILAWNDHTHPIPIYSPRNRWGAFKDGTGWHPTMKQEQATSNLLSGVELEMEFDLKGMKKSKMDRVTMAVNLLKCLGTDYITIKEDGTLLANGKYDGSVPNPAGGDETGTRYAGFEVATCPADLATHYARFDGFEEMPGYGHLRAWDTDTCGMHVHLTRDALSKLQMGRMLRSINHPNWLEFMQKVAGRTAHRWSRYYEKSLSDILHPDRICSPDESNEYNKSRRVALNISKYNPKTVEYRIFRGTVNRRHILRNIEFCYAHAEFCYPAARSFNEIDNYEFFVRFVGKNMRRWPLLCEWFVNQGMITRPVVSDKANRKAMTLKPELVHESSHPNPTQNPGTPKQKEKNKITFASDMLQPVPLVFPGAQINTKGGGAAGVGTTGAGTTKVMAADIGWDAIKLADTGWDALKLPVIEFKYKPIPLMDQEAILTKPKTKKE